MEKAFVEIEKASIERVLDSLREDYKVANEQLITTLDSISRRRIQGQMDSIKEEILTNENKLRHCEAEISNALCLGRRVGHYCIEGIHTVSRWEQLAKAWDERLERPVAIKFIRTDLDQTDQEVRQLEEHLLGEARLLARLKHPNIVQVHGIIDNPVAVIMEWTHNQSLLDLMNMDASFSQHDLIQIGIKLAGALKYLHEHGVINRNLKLNNIMLTSSNEPVLVDFFIAHSHQHVEKAGSSSPGGLTRYEGTFRYSPPEQIFDADTVGPPSDVFALGVLLYELSTRGLPFANGNSPALYPDGHLPEPDRGKIPESLFRVLCQMLSELPEQRPNAVRVQEQLATILDFLAIH